MQKFLRTLMLMALMAVPFASHAQTLPFTEGFGTSIPTGWTMYTGLASNVFNGTALTSATSGWNFGGNNGLTDNHVRVNIYGTSRNHWLVTPSIALTGLTSASLSFDLAFTAYSGASAAASNIPDDKFMVIISTDDGATWSAANATKWMVTDSVTAGVADYDLTALPYANYQTFYVDLTPYIGNTIKIAFYAESTVSNGDNNLHIDNVYVGETITCFPLSNLTVSAVTSNSLTLNWTDALNTGATYSVIDAVGSVVATGLTSTTYTVTGLNANTLYTFGVVANCSATDASNAVITSGRTACAATTGLPYVEAFNGYTGLPSYPYYGPSVLPACWIYYSNGTNTAETSGSSAYYGGVASYNGTSYGSHEANNPYLYLPIQLTGSAVTSSTYLGYSTARGDVRYAVMPAFATPINGLQIGFDYKMSSAYSATGAAAVLELGYVTNDDVTTFVSMWSANAVNAIQHVVDLNLSGLAAAAPADARLAFKFSGVHNGTGTSSYSNVACGIDNILVENLPSCARVTNLTVSGITNNSVTLNWVDSVNSGATYTVSGAAGVIATGINGTTYTVTGLTGNTDYTFSVVANCSANDNSAETTVSTHTDCDAMTTLPYLQTFEAEATGSSTSAAFAECWNRLNNGTQYFGQPYISSSSSYNHTDGGTKGLYWNNSITAGTYGDYQCVVLPGLGGNYSVSGCRLKFWAKASSTSYHPLFYVGVMTDAHDINSFEVVDSVNVEGTAWTEYTVNLNGYNGNGKFVAIRANRPTSSWTAYVDDILLEELPSCFELSDLTAGNQTANSVTLTWSDNLNTNATYSVYRNDTLVASNISGTTYTVANLAPNTAYTFGVVANCSPTEASVAITVSARTVCTALPLPYAETFDSYSTTSSSTTAPTGYPNIALPECWTFVNMSDNTSAYPQAFLTSSTSYAVSGNCLFFKSSSTTPIYAVLPAFETPANNQEITFTYRNEGATASNGILSVGMMGGNGVFVPIETLERITTLTEHTTVLPASMFVDGARVAFCYTGGTNNNYYLSIDNVDVHDGPSCMAPTALAVTYLGGDNHAAQLTWTSDATQFNVSVNDTVTYGFATSSPAIITGLAPNTTYTFMVQASCGNDVSDWSNSVSIHTPCNAIALPFTESFEATSATRDCWDLVSNNTANVGGSNGMGFVTLTDGNGALRFSSWSSASDYNQYAYSPIFDASTLTGADSLHVRVRYATYGADDHLWFGYRMVGDTGYTWTSDYFTTSGQSDMQYLEANLPLNVDRLAVHYYGNYQYQAWIDSVEVTAYTEPVTTIVLAINDTTLGYITPEPGTYNVAIGDSLTVTAVPFGNNVFNGWLMTHDGDTMMTMPLNPFTLPANEVMLNHVIGLQAQFATPDAAPDSVTYILATADATMGTTSPAPGIHRVAVEDTVYFIAQPNEGYHLLYWVESVTVSGMTFADTIFADTLMRYPSIAASEMTFNLTAYFEADDDTCIVALPFTEDFEGADLGCWTIDGPGNWTIGTGDYSSSTGAYSGSTNAKITHSTEGNVTKLISPVISGAENGVVLSFAHVQRSWTGDQDELRVYSRASATADWQMVAEYTNEVATWTLETLTIGGNVYQVAFEMTDGYGYGVGVDAVNIMAMSSDFCFAPTGLAVNYIGGNTNAAELTWTSDASLFNLSVNGTVTLGFATSSPATITGLDPNTTYVVMIQANCGNDTSAWTAPVTFTTPCDAIALPFVENFEETSATVNCWNFVSMNAANGLGTSNGMGFVTLTNGNRAWRFSSYSSASDYNQYGYSPIFNATADASALNVKVRYATYGSSDHLTFGYVTATDTVWDSEYHATSGQSDMQYYETVIPTTATQLAVHYYGSYSYYAWIDSVTVTEMTDAYCYAVTGLTATPAAFEVALTWNDANNDGASYSVLDATGTPVATGITGNNYTVTGLTPETSYTFAVVANCSATSASDAATVSTTTLPSCPAPTNLTVTLTPGDGTVATLAWTAGAQETAWQICLNGDTNNYIDVTTNPYTLTNLTAEQAYTAKVRAYCSADDQSAWSNTVNFTPTNAYSITVADGQATNSYVPVYGLYVDAYLNAQFVYPASALSAIAGQNLTQMTFYATQSSVNWGNANFKVYLTEIADASVSTFTDVNNMTLVYDGSLGITDNQMVVTFDDEYYYAGGNLMVAVIEDVTGSYVTSTWYGVETAGASVQGYSYSSLSSISPTQRNFMPKTTINYTEGVVPTCPKPTAVNVAYNGGTTATVSWTSDANAFNMEVNGTVTYGVNNPATITGLDLATTYTIRVQANCGNDTSEWTNPVTFHTDNCLPEDQCQITIYAQDSYGDGWNGNTINVYQNGALVESYSMASQSMMSTVIYDTAVITVCAGMPISFNWVSGGTYSYPEEVSFTIANALGQTVINAAGTDMTEGVFLTLDSCNAASTYEPDSMKVTVAVNDATMGTTVPAPGVHYFYEGDTASVVAVPNNGYHLLGWTLYVTMDTTVALDTTINYAVDNVFDLFQGGWVVSHGDNIYEWTVTANFEADPTCMPVTDLTVDSITESSVTISWTNSTAASYDIYNGTTFVANVTTNTYTFTGLADGTAYTFGVMALCSATDNAAMVTVSATTLFDCADITTLPYNEGFENGVFGCWTTVNGSSDGEPWNVQTAFSSGTITPHTGTYMAASWSWNSISMHANAWLISPKFVLPTVNAGDSLTFTWWEKTNGTYPDHYSVAISTTTNDTASFVVVRPDTTAQSDWTMQSIDLTSYAGQSVYVAFHHVDYDMNYLLIDDISLFQGAYVPPAPDTLTVTFATNDATMGTTIPAPGTYQYFSGDTVTFEATANAGYRFNYWLMSYGNTTDTVEYQNAYATADVILNYYGNNVTLTAYFEAGNPDSTTITYAVNDATMGTTVPAPGTYTLYVGDAITAEAVANEGYVLNAWVFDIVMSGIVYSSDTIYSDDPDFENPMTFGTLPQTFADYGASIVITALFQADTTIDNRVLHVTYAMNNSAWGTINPAAGTYTITGADVDNNFTYTATENDGYQFDYWVNTCYNQGTVTHVDTVYNCCNNSIYSVFMNYYNADSMVFEAFFSPVGTEMITVTFGVNDATMGTIDPNGTVSYAIGDSITITATPFSGFTVESWTITTAEGQSQTINYDGTTYQLQALAEYDGLTVIVNFRQVTGIDDVETNDFTVYSVDDKIVVKGVENKPVYVYDVNGRCVRSEAKASETFELTVSNSGVYLVKVADAPAKRVVVVR